MDARNRKLFIRKCAPKKTGPWWGEWHAKVVEGQNKTDDYLRYKAGVKRLTKSELKKKLMEDLKHGD